MKTTTEVKRPMFLPPPLADDWSRWIVGEWEGAGKSDTGQGKGIERIEFALNGQFLICRGEARITEITRDQADYLKKNMQASDEEIERFKREGYQSLQLFTVDQTTGEVIGYLFDSLRCIATGRGKRECMWVRRAALVALVPFARRGEQLDLAYRLAEALLGEKTDLMHKALGWLLREAGRTDAARLKSFLLRHQQAIPRTTVRYAIERFHLSERQDLLKLTRGPLPDRSSR